jgi:hypothetical protein
MMVPISCFLNSAINCQFRYRRVYQRPRFSETTTETLKSVDILKLYCICTHTPLWLLLTRCLFSEYVFSYIFSIFPAVENPWPKQIETRIENLIRKRISSNVHFTLIIVNTTILGVFVVWALICVNLHVKVKRSNVDLPNNKLTS